MALGAGRTGRVFAARGDGRTRLLGARAPGTSGLAALGGPLRRRSQSAGHAAALTLGGAVGVGAARPRAPRRVRLGDLAATRRLVLVGRDRKLGARIPR